MRCCDNHRSWMRWFIYAFSAPGCWPLALRSWGDSQFTLRLHSHHRNIVRQFNKKESQALQRRAPFDAIPFNLTWSNWNNVQVNSVMFNSITNKWIVFIATNVANKNNSLSCIVNLNLFIGNFKDVHAVLLLPNGLDQNWCSRLSV